MSKRKSKPSRRRASSVVPMLPAGYRDRALPLLPPRNAIVHIASADPYQRVPSGIEPDSVTVVRRADGTQQGTVADSEVLELMLLEGRMRDEFADAACVEVLAAMQGQQMTAALCHTIRMRLRKLGDDVHVLARVANAHIRQREWARKRSKVDPMEVCRFVDAKIQAGAAVLDAFIQVSEEKGIPESTVRTQYYKNRKARRTK